MQTVARITSILSELRQHPEGIGVIEISENTKLPASSVHRILQSLLSHELVWQDPKSRQYGPGMGLLELGWPLLRSSSTQRWRQTAHYLLANLSLQRTAQVFLGVFVQDTVVIVEATVPSRDGRLPITIPCMDRIPVHCGSSAKAILAYLPNQTVRRIITRCNFLPYTMYTLANQQELLAHLHNVREQRYATCMEEFSHDSYAISVPILDANGYAFASVGVGPLRSRPNVEAEQQIVRELQSIAAVVSQDV